MNTKHLRRLCLPLFLLWALPLCHSVAADMPVWAEGEHANFYLVKYTPGKKWNHQVDYWQQSGVEGSAPDTGVKIKY